MNGVFVMEKEKSPVAASLLFLSVPVMAVVYFLILKVIVGSGGFEAPKLAGQTETILLIVLGVIALSMFPAITALRKIMGKKEPPEKGHKLWMNMLTLALCHDPAIMGLVAAILTGKVEMYYLFGGWSIVLYLFFRPKE